MDTPSLLEDHSSQVPALQFLDKLGYTYLTPLEAFIQRKKNYKNVILEGILKDQLGEINSFTFKGQQHKFTDHNLDQAVEVLKNFPLNEGLIRANQKAYDLLTLGKSFEQTVDGDRKSFSLQYIDWDNPENNVYHVVEEYEVERVGREDHYRPDIVLFVNGIPLVVIECKRADLSSKQHKKPVKQAISQHLRNQQADGIPQLYVYSQLLLSLAVNDARYGTTGTPMEFWSVWKEQFADEQGEAQYIEHVEAVKNRQVKDKVKDKLFADRSAELRDYFDEKYQYKVKATAQDRVLYSLCRPNRLLKLAYQYLVYDAGSKKIARYQQFFAVEKSLRRVKNVEDDGQRQGGVIWHTQGSGKSLTMVMLAKALALDESIKNPRIVLVTDRVDLDDQLYSTFKSCGKDVVQAQSGRHLRKIIGSGRSSIITTVLHKFDAAHEIAEFMDEDPNIFVLVDESHRSVYGSIYVTMKQIFPKGCYIGFTGTPLMKKDKNTANKFGGMIDKYTIDQAVEDKAVVPLLYEGRHVVQDVNRKPIDRYFDLISKDMSEEQKAALKHKFARADQLNEADQKLYSIAWDVTQHFTANWQDTGYKAQLTAPSKRAAITLKRYFDDIGLVSTEVLISGPDNREGHEDIYETSPDIVQKFWKRMMERFRTEERYNKDLIRLFKHEDQPEIIIVVDKLLTGFDAPRNTVLYIARNLREHTLLQAVARVNRVHEGKDYGHIIDYYGVLGELNQALTTYSSLSEFDEEDLQGTMTSVNQELDKLPQYHSQLWDLFKMIENKRDQEAFEELLADEALRVKFYDRLSKFARTLKLALSTVKFVEGTDEDLIEKYKEDSKFFLQLRTSVKSRYSDDVDYSQYETQVQKLIDTHITADKVIEITPQVDIFNKEKFEEEVNKLDSTAAKADTIASRTKKTITQRMDQDPAYYRKFSEMLDEVIQQYRQQRLTDSEYLQKVTQMMQNVQNRTGDEVPTSISNKPVAKAYYGKSKPVIAKYVQEEQVPGLAAEIALEVDQIIKDHLVVDWQRKQDVRNSMKNALDEYLYSLEDSRQLRMPLEDIDQIVDSAIEIAVHRPEYQ